jgi:hypothetical protein
MRDLARPTRAAQRLLGRAMGLGFRREHIRTVEHV